MARRPTFRQMLLSILSLRYDRSQKEIGAAAGIPQKQVSYYLRSGDLKDEVFERLLAGLNPKPGSVAIVTACLEALEALEQEGDLTEEERAQIEEEVLVAARITREDLTEALRRARTVRLEGYPRPADLAADRWRAGQQWERLKDLSEGEALGAVDVLEELQTWAVCERVCEESVLAASRDLKRAATLARIAQEIADRIRGPKEWHNRVRGYAAAHGANVLRVVGQLKSADAALEQAKRLWHAGSDPEDVLDPGRLLSLEGSLLRDQRRFEEALICLDEAAAVGRSRERSLVKKAFTLEVMGEYGRAVETLLHVEFLVRGKVDPRLLYMLRFNLAVNYCHLGRFGEAEELVQQVRDLAMERGDRNEVTRVIWLEGRIAAGLGRTEEARRLLATARQRFVADGMSYDAALALLEEAVMALDEGRSLDFRGLAQDLAKVFHDNGVHREALAALGLFQEAIERETATVELARGFLQYLYRARYDQGLRFTCS